MTPFLTLDVLLFFLRANNSRGCYENFFAYLAASYYLNVNELGSSCILDVGNLYGMDTMMSVKLKTIRMGAVC